MRGVISSSVALVALAALLWILSVPTRAQDGNAKPDSDAPAKKTDTSEDGAEEPTTSAPPPVYQVAIHARGKRWDADKPIMEQEGLGAHIQFLKKLNKEGVLREGGPFLDGSGGMVILKGISLEDAKARMAKDPAVTSGLLTVTVRSWLAAERAKTEE